MKCKSTMGSRLALSLLLLFLLQACSSETPQSLVASGKSYLAKKDHKAAVVQFKSALQLDPQSAEVRYLLGRALLDSGDPTNAVLELGKAMDQQYSADLVVPALARAHVLTGEYKKVTTLFGEMKLQDRLAHASLKASVATSWGAQGERAKTELAIQDSLAAVPEYGPAQILNARILAGKREFDDALAVVQRVIQANANDVEATHLKGEILLLGKGDAKGAEVAFARALEIEKAFVPAHTALIGMRITAKDVPAAKAQADALRAVLPKHPLTIFIDAQVAFIDRNFAKARELTQQLLKVLPAHVGVLQLSAVIEAQLGSLVVAESQLNKALQINPNLPAARRTLAQVYLRLGQAQAAIDAVQPLLQSGGATSDMYALAAEAQLRLGAADIAETLFRRAAELSPDDARIKTAIALTNLSRGRPDAAFVELTNLASKSSDIFPDQAIVSARMRRREYDAALAAVESMARKAPGNASVAELRGRVQLGRKDYAAARAAFEEALKLDPAMFAATTSLSAIDVMQGRVEQARKRMEESIQREPSNHYARLGLAELRLREDAPLEEVRRLLGEAIKAAPSEAEPRLRLIDLTLRKRLFKEALAAAQDALAVLPNDVRIIEAAGSAQLLAGDIEQAITTYRKLVSLDPKNLGAYLRLADVYKAAGKRAQSESILRKALEVDPSFARGQQALVESMIADKRTKEALDHARNLQSARPRDEAGFLLEGAVHQRLKAPDAAVAAYKRGMATVPNAEELARQIYITLSNAKRAAEAHRFGTDWLKTHAKDAGVEYQMAVDAIKRNDLADAEPRLLRVVALRPTHPLALNNLAWVLVTRGKPGALAYARRAVDLMPDQVALIDTLAQALAAEGKGPEAMEQMRLALKQAPNDDDLRFNYAKIAIKAGDKVAAKTELERLQSLGTKFRRHAEVPALLQSVLK